MLGNTVIFLLITAFLTSVTSTVWLIKIVDIEGAPLEIGMPIMAAVTTISTFMGSFAIRQCELIHLESVNFVKQLQHEAAKLITFMVAMGRIPPPSTARGLTVYRRSFRRKPLAVRAGLFFMAGAGLGMNYLAMVADNVVSLMLVVDTRYPLTLILAEGVGRTKGPPEGCRL